MYWRLDDVPDCRRDPAFRAKNSLEHAEFLALQVTKRRGTSRMSVYECSIVCRK